LKGLSGSTVVVTGASGLLGFHHVHKLLVEGAVVIAVDLFEETLKKKFATLPKSLTPGLHLIACDITSEYSLRRTLEPLMTRYYITGLVNNAAINPKVEEGLGRRSNLLEETWEDWNLQLKVGLYGAFNCIRVLAPHMLAHGMPSSIVNISSDYGHLAPNQSLYFDSTDDPPVKPLTYSIVKHGVVGLTRFFATFWAGMNIRVNALAPGGVMNGQEQSFLSRISSEIPMARMARPDEFGGALTFLLSNESSYLNGQEIVVDGGRAVW
jgi:NAD(P)-dependent dehydrogenase (short-subunit alcohol dehydrogenase family)